MAELEGLEPAGDGWRAGDERRRGRGAGRDPRHRRAPEDARRRGRGAPAGPRRQPLRELRRAAHARPHGRRRGRRRLGAAGGAHAGRRRRRGHRPAPRRRAHRAGRLPRARPRAPEDRASATALSSRRSSARTPSPACARATSRRATPQELELGGAVRLRRARRPTASTVRDLLELDDDGRIPTDAALQTELAGRVRGRHRAPRLARAGGHLGRRRRGGGQGGAPLPRRASRGASGDRTPATLRPRAGNGGSHG